MTWIVLMILLGIATAGLAAGKRAYSKKIKAAQASETARVRPQWTTAEKALKWATVTGIGLMALTTLLCSFQQVGTKEVGIETSFGATSGHLTNGAHMIWPWKSVTEMDGAIQTDSYTDKPGDEGSPLAVRIGNQQIAYVSVSIRWRINPDYADSLFQNYRDFSNVRDSLVTRELTAAVNNQFRNYNPLNSVAASPTTGKKNPSLATYATAIAAQMKREIGHEGIEVINVIVPLVTFDSATQNRLNQLQQQFAQTLIAEQAYQTNVAQAKANEKLAVSVNTSPNVLVAECLQTLQEMVKASQPVPVGFSCWPGGSKAGGIIVNAAGGK